MRIAHNWTGNRRSALQRLTYGAAQQQILWCTPTNCIRCWAENDGSVTRPSSKLWLQMNDARKPCRVDPPVTFCSSTERHYYCWLNNLMLIPLVFQDYDEPECKTRRIARHMICVRAELCRDVVMSATSAGAGWCLTFEHAMQTSLVRELKAFSRPRSGSSVAHPDSSALPAYCMRRSRLRALIMWQCGLPGGAGPGHQGADHRGGPRGGVPR